MAPFMDDTPLSGMKSPQKKLIDDDFDTESLIKELTLEEKASLLAGKDFWHTTAVPRLRIPSIRLSDGPNGIRGTKFYGSTPSACLPCGTAIGATFDKDLAQRIGHLLADEAKAKGAHVVLGPTINIQRGPLGGRGFESFSEDPVLSGTLAGYYCKGLQERDIVTTPKHFVCNDQEHERMAVSSIVTERALREIYLLSFQIAIKLSTPRAIMTAYNRLNGTHCAERKDLLQDILRGEWGWKGLVMSDWFGTYSTSEALQAGLDLEMPGPTRWRGKALTHAVQSNKVRMSELDERVRPVLDLIKAANASGVPEDAPEEELNRPEDQLFLREVASKSIVLLKNNEDVLPLKSDKRIAVIGPNAKIATYCGGGSASLNAYRAATPFEGITAQAKANVDFAQGAYGHRMLPQLGKVLRTVDNEPGFTVRTYNEPSSVKGRKILEAKVLNDSNIFFVDYDVPGLQSVWYAEAEGIFTPEESGEYDFGLAVCGTAELFIDGQLIISNVENQRSGSSFLGTGTVEEKARMHLKADRSYHITLQWGCNKTSTLKRAGTVDFGHGGLRFGGCKHIETEAAIEAAVKLAYSTPQTVLFAGLSGEWESEGEDRPHMDLPPHSDELISRVLDANPNTIVVIQSGTPVTMPWVSKAKAIVQAWYGGDETGHAIADVVYGAVNPSGKLPLTFPKKLKDNPTYLNYRSEGGRVLYGEDVYVGYRYYEEMEVEPLFAFGHGLSYTTFELSDLELKPQSNNDLVVKCSVHNTGSREGAETVQIYVAPVSPPLRRPVKELKGFTKMLLAPGRKAAAEVSIDLVRATSYWEEKESRWCSAAGEYKVMVGTSSEGKFLEALVKVQKTTFWNGL
ncbi:hypothetical protein B0A48_08388 [Cryoendolithus antarcticus]|uniref:beta-glucosidase n=1 Tax=Cryoendolithus antarcticus TaxID=1507870 RepID=A0A1V8T5B0_9PEZI|nr:hypothetical protein B0A48_08388 [Cryoendolithus antarcticus]